MPRTLVYDRITYLNLEVRKEEGAPATTTVSYTVSTVSGESIAATLVPTLTAAQLSQLRDLMTNVILPQIKAAEAIP